jgi:hypothetical protein
MRVCPAAWGDERRWLGHHFVRNIAMCFDNTLAPVGERRHSKTI